MILAEKVLEEKAIKPKEPSETQPPPESPAPKTEKKPVATKEDKEESGLSQKDTKILQQVKRLLERMQAGDDNDELPPWERKKHWPLLKKIRQEIDVRSLADDIPEEHQVLRKMTIEQLQKEKNRLERMQGNTENLAKWVPRFHGRRLELVRALLETKQQ